VIHTLSTDRGCGAGNIHQAITECGASAGKKGPVYSLDFLHCQGRALFVVWRGVFRSQVEFSEN
jgi:hypothetical protein